MLFLFLFSRIRWLKREGGGNEIESFLKKAPFENYPLFLGAMKLKSGIRMFRQMQRRKVRSEAVNEHEDTRFFLPFFYPHPIFFSLPPIHSRNLEPGSHSRLSSLHPTCGSCLAFIIERRLHIQPFIPSSTHVECTAGTFTSLRASEGGNTSKQYMV